MHRCRQLFLEKDTPVQEVRTLMVEYLEFCGVVGVYDGLRFEEIALAVFQDAIRWQKLVMDYWGHITAAMEE